MENDMDTFVRYQRELIDKEQTVELEETTALLNAAPKAELQRRGLALYDVHVTSIRSGFRGKTVLDVEPISGGRDVFPPHLIRVGDLVSIDPQLSKPIKGGSSGKAGSASNIANGGGGTSGVVSKVFDARLSVVVGGDDDIDVGLSDRCRVAKLANNVTYERMKYALTQLQRLIESPGKMNSLSRVLLRYDVPDKANPDAIDVEWYDDTLNDSQKDAVRFALASGTVALIHGPPGTGKTFTLVEIIRQLAKQGKKILVCGPSNISVDNLVERLAKRKLSIIRLGHPARMLPAVADHALDVIARTCDAGKIVDDLRTELDRTLDGLRKMKNRADRKQSYADIKDLRKDLKQRERNVVDGILKEAQVTLSTLNGVGSKLLNGSNFDVVIIDEATQALEAECWIALLKGEKAILAGDHLQLPPTVKSLDSDAKAKKSKAKAKAKTKSVSSTSLSAVDGDLISASKGLTFTLFERLLDLYGSSVKRVLTTQYRMNELIMAYPSDALYEGLLIAHNSVKDRTLAQLPDVAETEDTTCPLLLIDTTGSNRAERAEGDEDSRGKGSLVADESKSNEGEAELVVRHVEALKQAGVGDENMAVITPYNAQVSLLKRLLKEDHPNLEIGSVDGFQGREKEAIILSLVRSNDKKEVGFLSEKRRINVAITRPKRHLCVICDSETVGEDKFLADLCEYIMEQGEVRYAE